MGSYTPTGSNFTYPQALAIDGGGNVWVGNLYGNSITELSNAGALAGYFGGLAQPEFLAVDGSGNVWTTNYLGNSVTELLGAAVPTVMPLAANLRAPYGARAVNRP